MQDSYPPCAAKGFPICVFFPILALTCLLGAPACNKDDDASAGSAKGGATPAANAPAAAPDATLTATDCPKSLEGYESQHRVITQHPAA